jgi:hypothetical protein
VITFVLIMVGVVLPLLVLGTAIWSGREAVRDRNAAHRNLRGSYNLAGVKPPDGL